MSYSRQFNTFILICLTFLSFTSCQEVESLIKAEPLPGPSGYFIEPGDIIVISYGNDQVLQYDSVGNFKRTLYSVNDNALLLMAIAWSKSNGELLLTTDGNDRVLGISGYDGSTRDVIVTTQLNGALRGVVEIENGDILVLESNNLERFTPNGGGYDRVTTGFPISNFISNGQGAFPLQNGGFVVASRGTDVVRTYDDTATQQDSVSNPASANDGYFATELDNGNIVAAWNGSSDKITEYDSSLTATGNEFNNTAMISNPRGVAQLDNGNIVVSCYSLGRLVEIDSGDFSFVRILASVATPTQVIVVPAY